MNDGQQDLIGQVDLAFVIDTTSSMSSLINAAKEHVRIIAEEAVKDAQLSLQIAIVEYRDHPPQDTSFVTNTHPFESNLNYFQNTLSNIYVHGGGDEAEAVYDGIFEATKLGWRKHADKNIWLVGDAAPHGGPNLRDGASSNWRQQCPCGTTEDICVRAILAQNITLNAITLLNKSDLEEAFKNLAVRTGGEYSHRPNQAQEAMKLDLGEYLVRTSSTTNRNRSYHTAYNANISAGLPVDNVTLTSMTGMSMADVAASKDALRTRGIITEETEELNDTEV